MMRHGIVLDVAGFVVIVALVPGWAGSRRGCAVAANLQRRCSCGDYCVTHVSGVVKLASVLTRRRQLQRRVVRGSCGVSERAGSAR